MQEHIHTGPIAFAFAGFSALVLFNLLRLIAIVAADKMPRLSKVVMSSISFGVAPSDSNVAA